MYDMFHECVDWHLELIKRFFEVTLTCDCEFSIEAPTLEQRDLQTSGKRPELIRLQSCSRHYSSVVDVLNQELD